MAKHRQFYFLLLLALFTSSSYAVAQEVISGSVSDASDGSKLEFVSVQVKGSTNGTLTDGKGAFVLKVGALPVTLLISSIGYDNKEVEVISFDPINVRVDKSSISLDEVVVIGYGTAKKKDLTGSVASVNSKDFNKGPITNPLQQLQGKAAGVNITQVSSEPGSGPAVRIRGITSLTGGNDPLVVVDGIQADVGILGQIPPNEIEAVDILKDASATAIYGARGAAGVILITTKKGIAGKTTVEYSGFTSVERFAKHLDVLTADEWRAKATEWKVGAGADRGGDVDWYEQLAQMGMVNNHTLSLSGGTSTSNYRASINAILQKGTVIRSDSRNYIGRIQLTQKALDNRLELNTSLNLGFLERTYSPNSVGKPYFTTNLINSSYAQRPTDPVFNEDGTFFVDRDVFDYSNPYAYGVSVKNDNLENNMFGSFRAAYEIFSGLKAEFFGSWRKVEGTHGYYLPPSSTKLTAINLKGEASKSNWNNDEKLMDLILNYNKGWQDHSLGLTGVYEWQGFTYHGHTAKARGFVDESTGYNALKLGTLANVQTGDIDSYKDDRKQISFLGRVNYSYKSRYLITASIRRDGSSVLGTDQKWGNFPSIALAWNIGEENFMTSQNAISNLKLKLGYGVTGNIQKIGSLNSVRLVGSEGQVSFGGTFINSYGINQNENPNLRWETKKMANAGLEFSVLNRRLEVNVEAYTGKTSNLLFNYTVPQPPFPHSSILANVGTLQAEGIDLNLNYIAIDKKDFGISVNGIISLMRNKVLELSGVIADVPVNTNYVFWGEPNFLIKGLPIGTFLPFKHAGKTEANEEIIEDIDGDGKLDTSPQSKDRYNAGQALPKYTWSITPSLRYKHFNMSFLVNAVGGNKIYNRLRRTLSLYENIGKQNMLQSAEELNLFTSKYSSDLWLEKGDFARLANVNLGYTFNTQNLKAISALAVSITASNLFIITKYSGHDPEVNVGGGSNEGSKAPYNGDDNGYYPRTRSIGIGLNLSLK